MSCCSSDEKIIIVRGDDTDFEGQNFVTLNLTSSVWDLSELSATIELGGIKKTFNDLSSGVIQLGYTSEETSKMPFGDIYGVLKLYNEEKQVATIESLLPFRVVGIVHGDAIATKPYEFNIDVKQGGQTVLNIGVEAGVTVEVGSTVTLLPELSAYVINSGTPNHLVLDFGIPRGENGEDGKDGKDATINGHNAIALVEGTGISITDNDGYITIANTQTSAEWGNITGTLSNQTDLQNALNDKQDVISDLDTIRSGAAAGATALQPSDVVDSVDTTETDKPLSANMGKELQDQIDNLSARGRFLALWNCATGLAETNPPESPYIYKAGDYFIVGTIAESGQNNYKPTGSSYTTGVASTTVETDVVDVDDVYYYDGTNWKLQVNTQKTVSFVNIAGSPYDNSNLASALNAKVDDVQINGTSIVSSGVANIPYASTNNGGAIKLSPSYYGTDIGTGVQEGRLTSVVYSYAGYANISNLAFISKGTLENVITGKALLDNKATGTDSVGIGTGITSTDNNSVAIGKSAQTGGNNAVAVGQSSKATYGSSTAIGSSAQATASAANALGTSAQATGTGSLAVGYGSKASATYAIQIGYGTNSTANTLSVGLSASNNYTLMTSDGKIPADRLPIMGNNVFGIAKLIDDSCGLYVDSSNILRTKSASTSRIDAKANNFCPIVPANLDYAVKVGLTTNTQTLTSTEKQTATDWILPAQASDKVLGSDGTNASWDYAVEFIDWS